MATLWHNMPSLLHNLIGIREVLGHAAHGHLVEGAVRGEEPAAAHAKLPRRPQDRRLR